MNTNINLHTTMVVEAKKYLEKDGILPDHLFDYFFDYYTGSGEMPYGTAKARDGDPYTWIEDKLNYLGL